MLARTPARVLGVVALIGGLALAGQVPAATGQAPPELRPDKAAAGDVIDLDAGRVQVAPAGQGGQQTVTPLPAADGTTPGLLLTESDDATTVQSLESGRPATIAGEQPRQTLAAQAGLVELHFEAIARDGRPASADISIFDVDTGAVQAARRLPTAPTATCSTATFGDNDCILVPPGTYSVMGFVNTMPASRPSTGRERTQQNVSLVGDPELTVTGNQTVTLDARQAREIRVNTLDHRSQVNPGGALQLGFTRTAANGRSISPRVMPSSLLEERFFVQPTAAVTLGELRTMTRLKLEAPDIEVDAPHAAIDPDYVDPVWFSDVASEFPVFDGYARLRVVDAGDATAADLDGVDLTGALALVERSDDLAVAEQSNAAAAKGARVVAIYNDVPGDSNDPGTTGIRLEVPTLRLSRAEGLSLIDTPGDARVGVRGESASPYSYDLVLKEHGRIPADLSYDVRDRDLSSQVRQLHGQPTIDSTFSEAAYQYQPGDTFAISRMFPFRGGPRSRVEYRLPDPDTRWTYAASTPESTYNALFPHPPVLRMLLSDPVTAAYEPGQRITKPVGVAPIASAPNPARPIQRSGDLLRVNISGFVDANGNFGSAYSDASGMRTFLRITADDTVVGETEHLPSGTAALPPGESRVAVGFTTDNPQPWAQLSTHTETRWSFPSTTVPSTTAVTEPVILADWDADVDLRNRLGTRAGRGAELALGLAHVPGATTVAPIDDVTVDASYDDGATWLPAALTRGEDGRHHVTLPPGSGFVSLRLHANDTSGSTLQQTIIRAVYVR